MKPHIKIDITAGTLANMTTEQFQALKDNVLREGKWDTVDEPVRIAGGDYLGIYLPSIFLGIEHDGYTHS